MCELHSVRLQRRVRPRERVDFLHDPGLLARDDLGLGHERSEVARELILPGCFLTFDAGLGLKRRLAHRVNSPLL